MALTVADIETGVQALGYEADTAAQQLAMINQVQRRFFGAHRWDVARVTATIPVVAGTDTYTLPTGVVHVSSVRLRNGSAYAPLEHAPREELLENQASGGATPARGTAYQWTRGDADAIILYPVPAGAGTLTVHYFKTCPLLTTGTDVPMLPEAYCDILIFGVAELLAKRERQMDAASAFRDDRMEVERQARAQLGLDQQQTPDRVTQSGFYGIGGGY